MGVYSSTGVSSSTALAAALEALLVAAGVHTTTHYESTGYLIVTLTRSAKVWKFHFNSARNTFGVSYGDAYDSGTTITNEVVLRVAFNAYACDLDTVVVVTNADALAVMTRRSASEVYHDGFLLATLDTVAKEEVALVWSSKSSAAVGYDVTNGKPVEFPAFDKQIVSATGYYYQYDVLVTESGKKIADAVNGVQHLCKPWTEESHAVYGDDVVLPGGQHNGDPTYFSCSFLLAGANTWAPTP